MFRIPSLLFFLLSAILYSFLIGRAQGATLAVGPGQTYSTIGAAIAASQPGDLIQVYPNPPADYPEDVTLKSGTVLQGIETAQSRIIGSGTGNTVTMATNSTVMNMTISNSNPAVNSSAIYLSGIAQTGILNILIVSSQTGILCNAASGLTITNNTIDANQSGVFCSGNISGLVFENNIVSNSAVSGINFSGATISGTVDFNDTFNNGSNSYLHGPDDFSANPLFVNPAINDYHLQASSPCIDRGDPSSTYDDKEVATTPVDHTRNDCGAYGGPGRDTTPFQIQNLVVSPGATSAVLTWDANLAYDTSGYLLYFDNQSHTFTDNIPSPPYNNLLNLPVSSSNCITTSMPQTCSYTLSLAPPVPAGADLGFGDQELFLTWTPGASAFNLTTGYDIYFKPDSGTSWTEISVGNVTSYTLTGLTNLTVYDAYMTASANPQFYFNVLSQDSYTTPHLSRYLTPDIPGLLNNGSNLESPHSPTLTNFPEPLAPFPDLPNRGSCFIATAAYGSYLDPHVRLLRLFRDEVLEHSNWGRALVVLYYRFSPAGASYLNQHPWLKPWVRAVLTPLVALSYFLIRLTFPEKWLIGLLVPAVLLFAGIFYFRRVRRSGV